MRCRWVGECIGVTAHDPHTCVWVRVGHTLRSRGYLQILWMGLSRYPSRGMSVLFFPPRSIQCWGNKRRKLPLKDARRRSNHDTHTHRPITTSTAGTPTRWTESRSERERHVPLQFLEIKDHTPRSEIKHRDQRGDEPGATLRRSVTVGGEGERERERGRGRERERERARQRMSDNVREPKESEGEARSQPEGKREG